MNLNWLQICAEGQTADCIAPIQVAYLVALVIGAVLLAIIGRRSRDFTTSVLSLMAVAIAINIAVGSIIYRAAPPDLPRFDRDRARRRARRTMGRRPDRHPVQPHLVDPADPGRRQPDGRVLRAGRRASSA